MVAAIIFITLAFALWFCVMKIDTSNKVISRLNNDLKELDIENRSLKGQIEVLKRNLKTNSDWRSFSERMNKETVNKNELTVDELRKVRYYIHPDKNAGKTHELFLKVNKMIEET